MVILVLAVAIVAWLFLRGPAGHPPGYGQECTRFHQAVFGPLEQTVPLSTHEMISFVGQCQRRIAAKGADAAVAAWSADLVGRLQASLKVREQLAGELRQALRVPPSVFQEGSAAAATNLTSSREGERARRQEFMINQIVQHKWLPYVQKARPPCDDLLARILEAEGRLTPGARLWDFVQNIFSSIGKGVEKIQALIFGDKTASATAAPAAAPAGGEAPAGLCAACQGTGRIKCPSCGGFGSIESAEHAPCGHCGGTGQYRKRLGDGLIPCTFCRGTGQAAAAKRISCTTCQGTGQRNCPDCKGAGAARP